MEDIFISHIHINKVRHLQNLDIPLSTTERQHLILTGGNGSGKTSFLLALKAYLQGVETGDISLIVELEEDLKHNESNIAAISSGLKDANIDTDKKAFDNKYKALLLNKIKEQKAKLVQFAPLNLKIENFGSLANDFQENNFILASFGSNQLSNFVQPKSPKKIDFKNVYSLEEKANADFIQYIVNLRYDKLDAKDTNDHNAIKKIDDWFDKFTQSLRTIFNDNSLTLEFDRPNYNYNIILRGHEKFDLNTLSDGYSAVINILTELLLRMEKQRGRIYDIQGIVLIDEIETHLHIDLQKKILPFLTAFFPKIQFIVTTHSPFVLTSVENAVVYDLERQQPIHDLSGYSVEAIIEAYFGQDKYASILTDKVNRYELLMSGNGLTEDERDEKSDLKGYFKNLPYFLAPELQVKIQQIELAQLGK